MIINHKERDACAKKHKTNDYLLISMKSFMECKKKVFFIGGENLSYLKLRFFNLQNKYQSLMTLLGLQR